jgi:hypothetical protein
MKLFVGTQVEISFIKAEKNSACLSTACLRVLHLDGLLYIMTCLKTYFLMDKYAIQA